MAPSADERDVLLTLFDLGRKIVSVIDLDELLPLVPHLVGRLIPFDAFAVYFYRDRRKDKRDELTLAYTVGYPDEAKALVRDSSKGLVGRAVTTQQPVVSGDLASEPDYFPLVPAMSSIVVVPLLHKANAIGALNVLSRERDRYTERDVTILRQFAAHVATALVNARLFERQRADAEAFETLAEIGREVAAVLDLERLLSRIAQLAARLVDYRTFGILLLNEATSELELKVGVQYGEKVQLPTVPLGEGLVGYAALHKVPVLAPDVSQDPRYIKVVEDVRSELVVPMLLKDRCIGVLDLESPELDAFSKRDVEILTLLASQAAVSIENARLYEEVSANESRLERELRFATRVQAALLPTTLPKRVKGIDVAASFAPARELGGDFHDFILPESSTVIVAVGDVSGKGVPAALYAVFAGELVRSRTFRRRMTERSSPAQILSSINTILHERQLEEYYCALCYAAFDLKRKTVTLANSGLPYPIRTSGDSVHQIELPGVPLGSFFGVTYDEVEFPLTAGDVYVFCSDGVVEAMNSRGEEYTPARLQDVVAASRHLSAAEIARAVVESVDEHRAGFAPNDDTTVVVVRVTT
ncbi:MAG: GAF domain-containing protein [Acidobacteria bacterium]|nr:GAF domain-containing protein [Acidobacteriota bacterium]